jgi:hypothetical protein
MIEPIVLGGGKRLFPTTALPSPRAGVDLDEQHRGDRALLQAPFADAGAEDPTGPPSSGAGWSSPC